MPKLRSSDSARGGRWEKQDASTEPFYCFIPASLLPNPPPHFDEELQDRIERANRALGRLDGVTPLLPLSKDISLHVHPQRGGIQIEGTQSSLSDLLLFENSEAPGPTDSILRRGCIKFRGDRSAEVWVLGDIHGLISQLEAK
jgi:hypothetical protein